MKLALGTAQFGMDYGLNNISGKTPINEVHKILDYALINDIVNLDTAIVYGESEKVIGQHENNTKFQVTTKLPKLDIWSTKLSGNIENLVLQSLNNLEVASIHALLLHDASDLLSVKGPEIFDILCKLKKTDIVQNIGVSVYDPYEVSQLIQHFDIDVIQLPLNVFDQRFLHDGTLQYLYKKGIKVVVRSVFLQGALLTKARYIPSKMDFMYKHLQEYNMKIEETGISLLEAALNFVKKIDYIENIVVGVNNIDQLKEITSAYKKEIACDVDYSSYTSNVDRIIDPRKW